MAVQLLCEGQKLKTSCAVMMLDWCAGYELAKNAMKNRDTAAQEAAAQE